MPVTLRTKYYLPTLARIMYHACRFITKHRDVILAAVAALSPADLDAVTLNLDAVVVACNLFISVMNHIDPNWVP